MSKAIFEKIIEESIAMQNADIKVISEKRGTPFKVRDAYPYVEAVEKMRSIENQCPEVFDLHKRSVEIHFNILKNLTETITVEESHLVECFQTPVLLEILYEIDETFREAISEFSKVIDKAGDTILKDIIRAHYGFYGPVCRADYTFSPGSITYLHKMLADRTKISPEYKETILAAKSFGINLVSFGGQVVDAIESGKNIEEAVSREKEMLKVSWENPMENTLDLLKVAVKSYDIQTYMKKYKEQMTPIIEAAVEAGIHYGNIVVIPTYCVGDVGNHIGPGMFMLGKDDMVMAVLEAVSKVAENTLRRGLREGKFKKEWQILKTATGAFAAAATSILELDAFTVTMVVDLLIRQRQNYILQHPRARLAEQHHVDLLDLLARGERILQKPPLGKGGKIGEVEVDLTPIEKNEVLMNPGNYSFYPAAYTSRFAALMKLAPFTCLMTSETMSSVILTNIAATHKERPVAPMKSCKGCAVSRFLKRHQYCGVS